MSQCHFVVTEQYTYRIEGPPCNHLTFREFFHEMTIECDPRTQGFETLFSRPSSDHRVIHLNICHQTVTSRRAPHGLLPRYCQSSFFQ